MFPIDMPKEIGSKQWTQWFNKQPPMIQNQVVSTITMSQLNDSVPQSSSVGGYAPELDPMTYGLLDQQSAPYPLDKKGNVEPYDLDVASKTTNVLQDRNTYLIDNAAAMQAGPGAYDASAFNPTMTPIGQPLQQPGQQMLQQYAGSGGSDWMGYMAEKMLQGISPAAAQAQLAALVSAPETAGATDAEKQQRAALIASLPGRQVKDPNDPFGQSYTFLPPDPKKLKDTVDFNKILNWGDEIYQKMATDPQAGYQDPTTGQQYVGAKAEDSTAAKWYHDRGLALPTDQYTDSAYLDQIAPADQAGWIQSREQAGQQADTAFADFQKEKANYDQMVAAWKATQDKMQAERDASMQVPQPPGRGGVPGPGGAPGSVPFGGSGPSIQGDFGPRGPGTGQPIGRTPSFPGAGATMPGAPTQRGPGGFVDVPGTHLGSTSPGQRFQDVSPFIGGPAPQVQGGLDPRLEQNPQRATGFPMDPRLLAEDITSGNWQPGQPAPGSGSPKPFKPVEGIPSGTEGIGWNKLQEMFDQAGFGGTGSGGSASGVFGGAQANDKVPTAADLAGVGKRAMPTNMNFALGIPGLANQIFGGGDKKAGAKKESDVDWGKAYEVLKQQYGRQETSREKNKRAIAARHQTESAPQDVLQRAFAYMEAQNLQNAGRTRLGDQLAQRALAARAAGLYGY